MGHFSGISLLNQLSHLYGIQTAYYDVNHHRQKASTESLLAMLRSLGAPMATLQDIPLAWRERRQSMWQRLLKPVIVAWDGEPAAIQIRLPSVLNEAILNCHLKLETGEQPSWKYSGADLAEVKTVEVEGTHYMVKQLLLPIRLPWGYHQLIVEISGRVQETLIISAPLRAYTPPAELNNRGWGIFLPLYALHAEKSWGSGDFSDLEGLVSWVGGMGGNVVATLPLLPTFPSDVYETSPYLPASRLLWNEFYLDVNKVPELLECPSAQAILTSSSFQDEIKALRNLTLVDYRRQMALKRQILQELSGYFFAQESRHREKFQRFTEANPVVEDYARFRAAGEKQGTSWRSWPQLLRDGVLKEGDYDEVNKNYYLYTQWLAHRQIGSVSEKAKKKGVQLYVDLPLGVHPDSYDVWCGREAFISDVSTGAPPDAVFTRGQDWGFPPLHQERIREQGYRYMIAYLRHHLRHAGILRIDHVMGLHRLFCIPKGMPASQGVYLHYPAEELYAILALESHRSKAIIVGEDLGTVPPYVRPAMKKHGLYRMYILHYELATNPQKGLLPVSNNAVASLNTHDMPPFASFWQGLDIKERRELDLLDKKGTREEKETRRSIIKVLSAFLQRKGWLKKAGLDTLSALRACLSFLAGSQARIVLVNLEDLWLETQSQNIPSTKKEYPNWRHKARYRPEEFCQMPQVLDTLQTINRLRKQDKYQK
jgi:4-alpha-glucanotransferase